MSRTDYKVQRRSLEDIKVIADKWRQADHLASLPGFNVVGFIQRTLSRQIKGGLRIKLVGHREGSQFFARVDFDPLALVVSERVWRQAQSQAIDGHDFARHILAHEVGHIVLHRDQSKAFSHSDGTGHFFDQEDSAEWQANTFARCFLVSVEHSGAFESADALARAYKVPQELAEDVISERRELTARRLGDFCERCGGCAPIRLGRTICVDCAATEVKRLLCKTPEDTI